MDKRRCQEEEDRLYRDYYRQVSALTEERENIEKEMRLVEDDHDSLDDVDRGIYRLFRDISEDCYGDRFAREMDLCEDRFLEYRRQNEREIEDMLDRLHLQRKDTYEKEDEIREQYKKDLEDLHRAALLSDRE